MNKLQNETSPYLKQHRHNPVDWYPWGEEAFEAARSKNCPIFLSIGYSTCYWCHVMEKDSFERTEVAEVLNRHFVCIKVDREERPDVDSIYMEAVIAMTGHGGWPMSVFLTPDLKPFWGATYIPRERFIEIATRVAEIWKDSPSTVLSDSDHIRKALAHKPLPGETGFDKGEALKRACESLSKSFDKNFGGFGPAPKFPPTQQIKSLLLGEKLFRDEKYSYAALISLEHIGRSALHDHIEGGFHRYATDEMWEIPHFEKMLYDNALLSGAFLKGFEYSQHEAFLKIAQKTASYLFNRLQNGQMFSSAEDAGDVGKEGEFYSWDYLEFNTLQEKNRETLLHNFTVSKEGNFEHKNTLVAKTSALAVSEVVNELYVDLKTIRDKRSRPHLDDKIIVSWNGLVLTFLANLLRYQKNNDQLVSVSKDLAHSLCKTKGSNGNLLHLKSSKEKQIAAMLEDYAYVIEGLISLYQTSFEEKYLLDAYKLMKEQVSRLWDTEAKLFKSSTAPELVLTKFEILDGALPSTNAVSYGNLKFLSVAFNDHSLHVIQSDLQKSLSAYAHRYPTGCLRFLQATFDWETQIVIVAPHDKSLNDSMSSIGEEIAQAPGKVAVFPSQNTIPESKLPIIAEKLKNPDISNDSATFFLCEHGQCQLPTSNLKQFLVAFATSGLKLVSKE